MSLREDDGSPRREREAVSEPQAVPGREPQAETGADPGASAQDLALRGWRSRLAVYVTSVLALQALTGLWIYLAPFSIASQVQVLVHVALGLALVVPLILFQLRHLLVWWRQRATPVMVLGYALLLTVAACVVSGLVLTWQGALGPRLSGTWDLIHLVSGIATAVILPVHLTLAVLRRRHAARTNPELAAAMRRFFRRGAGWLAPAAATVIAAAALWPRGPVELPPPEGYHLSSYLEQFEEYRGNPFAPAYARTESGKFIAPEVLSGSASCGTSGCHEEILAEWLPSAHRFSAMNPPFQAVQRNFAADRGPAETRYCAGCHDPISLFAGAKDIHNLDLSAPGVDEGCSCVVCHSISQVDQRGNADYVLTPPRKYLGEGQRGLAKLVSDFLIRSYPRQHLVDYDRVILRSPEFCGACHKQFIPEALNRFGLSSGQNQYDEWRTSHWHTDDPEKDLSCRDCHMRLVRDSQDPGRGEDGDTRRSPDDEAHRHHGAVATNFFMPAVLRLPHWEKQVRLTEEWMRGETVLPEIAHVWPAGPVATIQITSAAEAHPGEEVSLRVLITNRKAGHNFTTGPLDFVRAWVHVRVTAAGGAVLAEWGAIDPITRRITDLPGKEHQIGNSRQEGTLVLEGLPLDQDGNPIVRHELWNKAGGKGQRVVFPGYSDSQVFRFRVPEDAGGALTVDAWLNFRRYRQEFLDLVVPDMERETGVYQATVTQSRTSRTIRVATAPRPPEVAAPPSAQSGD